MGIRYQWFPLLTMLFIGVTLTAAGAEDKKESPPTTAPATGPERAAETRPAVRKIVYHPPHRGAPIERIGGGVRGDSDRLPLVAVLAPESTGLTTQSQPRLYWFLSADTQRDIELTITRDDRDDPVYVGKLRDHNAGYHAVELSAAAVKLETGIVYHWNIDLIVGKARGSGDVVAGGAIMRVKPAAPLAALLKKSTPAQRPDIYAANSIWYDGVAALQEEIDHDPNGSALRETRADLLQQVNINATADAILPPALPKGPK